jgi:hypothetical protein
MQTILGIVDVSKATPANRNADLKSYHTVYRHVEKNEDTLNQLVSYDIG